MICLDTNAVIALLNDTSRPLRMRLGAEKAEGRTVAIPMIVFYELWYGAAKSDRREKSSELISSFATGPVSMLSFEFEDAEEAGEIRAALERQGTPIGPYDILIAAQARRRGALLVTANTREFGRVPGLLVENWLA